MPGRWPVCTGGGEAEPLGQRTRISEGQECPGVPLRFRCGCKIRGSVTRSRRVVLQQIWVVGARPCLVGTLSAMERRGAGGSEAEGGTDSVSPHSRPAQSCGRR